MLSMGTDLIEIKRIEKSIQNERFVKRVFGNDEQSELLEKNFSAQSAAAAFAAKEAFSKAIGTGVKGFRLNEVQLLHNPDGAPYFKFCGKAKDIVEKLGYDFSVSITHTRTLASAVVAAYK